MYSCDNSHIKCNFTICAILRSSCVCVICWLENYRKLLSSCNHPIFTWLLLFRQLNCSSFSCHTSLCSGLASIFAQLTGANATHDRILRVAVDWFVNFPRLIGGCDRNSTLPEMREKRIKRIEQEIIFRPNRIVPFAF